MKQKSNMAKLFDYAGKFQVLIVFSWVLSAISALVALLPFVYIWKLMREVIEVAPNFNQAENLSHNGWMAVIVSAIAILLYIAALICSHLAAFRVQATIRSQIMHHITTLPLGFIDTMGSGKIRKIVNESSAATETYLAHQLPDKAGAIATPIGLLILLISFDLRLGILSLVPIILSFLIMSMMTGKEMQVKMKEYQDSLDDMSNEAVEYVRGIPVVKTFGQSVFSFKRFKASIDKYQKWVISYTKDLRVPMILYTTAINSVFAILIVAAMVLTANGVTNDFLLNLMLYIIITPIITVTMNKIMYASENKMIVADAIKRIESIMDMKPLPKAKHSLSPKDNSVTIENVSFCYPEATTNAIDGITMHIHPGEHIALVGPSGGGKTTLASLLARFWDVTEGEIKIGGVNVKKINKEELIQTVSFVFQDSKLLKQSVYENVRMAKPDATRKQVLKALHDAQCDDIIEKLPNGVDTIIGEKGIYLSGGEQQRISIARVMLKNAPILILDEATAFADPDNEARVQKAFSQLSQGKTVIMIAHRLSTVTSADRIFVVQDGKVHERGTHMELSIKGGIYASMWERYNETAKWKVGA